MNHLNNGTLLKAFFLTEYVLSVCTAHADARVVLHVGRLQVTLAPVDVAQLVVRHGPPPAGVLGSKAKPNLTKNYVLMPKQYSLMNSSKPLLCSSMC